MNKIAFILLTILIVSCSKYSAEAAGYLCIVVDAPQLDFSNETTLIRTVAKHPRNYSKCGDVGHAWICVFGNVNDQQVFLEGGHSGEVGETQSRYFDGLMNYIDFGYSNPTAEECLHPRCEPNPVKYFWEERDDGFFQWGSGGHQPSYAICIPISDRQLSDIITFVSNYPFERYSITQRQCCSFVVEVAGLAGLRLVADDCLLIHQWMVIEGVAYQLWQDPYYSLLPVKSPDALERSMKQAVADGRAYPATSWAKKRYRRCFKCQCFYILETLERFPERITRCYRLFDRNS